ncbi:transglutaminase-like domain-containing protein [Verrucosispora sp. WMMC514]|uniref:transglutaminase-like domain-containing protein n=1 Tax=Verrucosispora sp. WMMC514 TaxID=3015156 RepID=UPI00248AE06E|nr:transglutaminase-like domain-containing protein [Verrucosispora sp. WMMC514]WBB93859.1 transglutaminase-like domain-containing protein [Verrucosispora sp. WMMC514]
MDQDRTNLSRYARPGRLTSAGPFAPLLEAVPAEPAEIARTIQGLLIHEHIADAYGVALTDADRQTVHLRPADDLLARIAGGPDAQPLTIARPPEQRVAGNCRHYSLLLVTALRARGVPARARCGFGDYFVDGRYEDHWVAEYWSPEQLRWIIVDAQLDARQRELFGIDFDTTDVPRDRFLVAGEAWARCRAGHADPDVFGLSLTDEGGWWWIAGNMMRDAAALHGVELLPWDSWGAMPAPEEKLDDERMALFDELARLTREPDRHADELRRLCADVRLRVPATVRNDVRGCDEPV